MAYDETLAARIRDVIGVRSQVREVRMMGGLVWMLAGNMACGTFGDDLMVRLGDDAERALAEPHVRQMEMKGAPMKAFVIVAAEAVADDAELVRWIDAGADFAASLPPK
jgi:hypothetical protein